MKRILKILSILLIIIPVSLLADDVYLKDGRVLKDAQIIKVGADGMINIKLPDGSFRTIHKLSIVKIDKTTPKQVFYNTYPNIKLLPASVALIGLTIEKIMQIRDINKTIIFNKKNDLAIIDLKKERNEKLLFGIFYAIAGITNTYFSLQKVQVIQKQNTVGLSYNF